jgi:hypothetical protein
VTKPVLQRRNMGPTCIPSLNDAKRIGHLRNLICSLSMRNDDMRCRRPGGKHAKDALATVA